MQEITVMYHMYRRRPILHVLHARQQWSPNKNMCSTRMHAELLLCEMMDFRVICICVLIYHIITYNIIYKTCVCVIIMLMLILTCTLIMTFSFAYGTFHGFRCPLKPIILKVLQSILFV